MWRVPAIGSRQNGSTQLAAPGRRGRSRRRAKSVAAFAPPSDSRMTIQTASSRLNSPNWFPAAFNPSAVLVEVQPAGLGGYPAQPGNL